MAEVFILFRLPYCITEKGSLDGAIRSHFFNQKTNKPEQQNMADELILNEKEVAQETNSEQSQRFEFVMQLVSVL